MQIFVIVSTEIVCNSAITDIEKVCKFLKKIY